jgi:hypothetical protein
MNRLLAVALCGTLLLPAGLLAADRAEKGKKPWIHIEVQESGKEEASVKVNLPLSMARSALEMAPDDVLSEGHIRIQDSRYSVDDLREVWAELRKAEDGEFVTVQEDEETVRVFKKNEMIFVHVDGKKNEKVRVEVPIALVDALLRGKGETLDVDAAVTELEKMSPGEIIRVEDGSDRVRVWIE